MSIANAAILLLVPEVLRPDLKDKCQAFTKLLSDVPQATWNLKTQLYESDILFLEWTAESAKTKIDDGIDTFIFKDGYIRAQVVRYTLQKK